MKTLVAIPCMDMCHTDFVRSLTGLQYDGTVQVTFSQSSLVYDSRNKLAGIALEGGFDRMLWLDSDMSFQPDLFRRLSARLDEGRAMCSALYITRKSPVKPCIYKRLWEEEIEGQKWKVPHADPYMDYPEDAVFPVAGCGFGGVMMTTELVGKIAKEYGFPFSPILGFGEDFSFCRRVLELGEEIVCDSSIKMGHVGQQLFTEDYFKLEQEALNAHHHIAQGRPRDYNGDL